MSRPTRRALARISARTAALCCALGVCALLWQPPPARAQPKSDWETAEEEKNWKEGDVQVPEFPKSQDLVEFPVSEASAFRFYVDARSISIGPDGVVRYSLVARSPSGSENVSFEGIRCKSAEFRTYAFGRADGSWSVRSTPWRKIQRKSVQRWHEALHEDYLCQGRASALSVNTILEGLKSGGLRSRQ